MKLLLKIIIIAFLSVGLIVIMQSCKRTDLPTVTTANVSGITQTSGISGGSVTDNGGAEVIARGVCWGTTEKPTISPTNKTSDGTGNGAFKSSITGLTPKTKYNVRAYATNSEGTSYGLSIEFTTLENPPVADFTASPTTIAKDQSVQFTDQSTNNPTSWSWNFGDGSTSTSQSPTHTYSTAGTYTVTLTATSSTGSDTETKTNYITVVAKPEAAFTASPTIIMAGQSVQFTDQSTNNPTSWSWNFGDGSTSTSQSPTHTYSTAGTYTVTQTATNIAGSDTETKADYIKVNPIVKATLTTNVVTSINSTTAVSGGNISSAGGGTIIERGVCWNTSGNPTVLDARTNNGTGTGSFTSSLTGLFDGTTYYVRAYATNSAGTAYGEQYSFITAVADKEGNVYKTVRIGTQVWMAENLKSTKLNDDTPIPNITDDNTWFNLTTMGYCWYDNVSNYKDVYGALYNWYTVNTGKLCPSGWHVPADYEWTELVTFVGGGTYHESIENANKLKETGYNHWENSCLEGTNESGFSALPGGIRFSAYYSDHECFMNLHNTAWWWTTSVRSTDRVWCYFVFCNGLQGTEYLKQCGMSIRCIKN